MDGGEREEERNVEIDTLYALAVSLGKRRPDNTTAQASTRRKLCHQRTIATNVLVFDCGLSAFAEGGGGGKGVKEGRGGGSKYTKNAGYQNRLRRRTSNGEGLNVSLLYDAKARPRRGQIVEEREV